MLVRCGECNKIYKIENEKDVCPYCKSINEQKIKKRKKILRDILLAFLIFLLPFSDFLRIILF